jgi:hypothetical protein
MFIRKETFAQRKSIDGIGPDSDIAGAKAFA